MSFWPFVSEEEDLTTSSNRHMENEEMNRLFLSTRSYPFPRVVTFENPDLVVQKYNKMKDKSKDLEEFTYEQKKTIDKIYSKMYKKRFSNAPDTVLWIDENKINLQWHIDLVSNSIPPENRSVLMKEMIIDCNNKNRGILYQENEKQEKKHFLNLNEALHFIMFQN
jgi:hypothetical protein